MVKKLEKSLEEEIAQELLVYSIMFDYFGWLKPRDCIMEARAELLDMVNGNAPSLQAKA